MQTLDPAVVRFVREASTSDRYAAYLRSTLLDLLGMNTAPEADLARTAAREKELFEWISREIRDLAGPAVQVERPGIDPAIADDPDYSRPGYAADADGRVPPVEEVYSGRGNLLAMMPGHVGGKWVILHAHTDVVPPWFAPRSVGERVFGRGACDNKAQVALLLAQIKLLREVEEEFGRRASHGRVYQFVIDEEIGGNGSLSLARDPRFARAPVLMHESTDRVPYCAHRGAVWYRCRLSVGPNTGVGAAEMVPLVVQELEDEGRRLAQETNHPMFTPAHVQTSHGVLGPYGDSPGVVNDHVAIEIVAQAKANPHRIAMKMVEILDEVMADYVQRYGDKTREIDPVTGKPKVDRHFAVEPRPTLEAHVFRIDVWGRRGHMGAIADCDGAITKAAHLLATLLRAAALFPGVRAYGRLADAAGDEGSVVLEGEQGFTPSHRMADVQSRMLAAARRGVRQYCDIRGCRYDDRMLEMTFDRLHNDAYADPPDIAPMQALRSALTALGEPVSDPVAWVTSCDARIYHRKGHPVAIFGAGRLAAAHSAEEYIDVPDLQKALAASTLATWAMIQ